MPARQLFASLFCFSFRSTSSLCEGGTLYVRPVLSRCIIPFEYCHVEVELTESVSIIRHSAAWRWSPKISPPHPATTDTILDCFPMVFCFFWDVKVWCGPHPWPGGAVVLCLWERSCSRVRCWVRRYFTKGSDRASQTPGAFIWCSFLMLTPSSRSAWKENPTKTGKEAQRWFDQPCVYYI